LDFWNLDPGNQLFNVVVENDDVALRCTELLNRGKLGRVTFMPLNRLNATEVRSRGGTALVLSPDYLLRHNMCQPR
jgi:chromosome segregation ATPase